MIYFMLLWHSIWFSLVYSRYCPSSLEVHMCPWRYRAYEVWQCANLANQCQYCKLLSHVFCLKSYNRDSWANFLVQGLSSNVISLKLCLLAYRSTTRTFRLALQGYSVASLPRATHFAITFSVTWVPRVLCFALAFSVALLLQASGFALTSCLLCSRAFCAHENFKKKVPYVSIDSKCSETHSAKPERRRETLPTPCHPQGPKECPCPVSCRLDQNCGG